MLNYHEIKQRKPNEPPKERVYDNTKLPYRPPKDHPWKNRLHKPLKTKLTGDKMIQLFPFFGGVKVCSKSVLSSFFKNRKFLFWYDRHDIRLYKTVDSLYNYQKLHS